MKKVTSVTVWSDSTGTRISVTHSEIDPQTRKVIADNIRENYILMDEKESHTANALITLAQNIIGNETNE